MSKVKVLWGAFVMLAVSLLSERTDVFLLWGLCALLHEAGHLIAARARGIEIEEIRIDFFGARICTREGAGSYLDELILAAAGPAVNVAAVAATALYMRRCGISLDDAAELINRFLGGEREPQGAVCFFALCALLQGGVNLLPIKSFDGGRILYCTAAALGQRFADTVTKISSAVCVFALWTVALYLMLRIGAGLGIYVFCACLFLSTLSDTELIKK